MSNLEWNAGLKILSPKVRICKAFYVSFCNPDQQKAASLQVWPDLALSLLTAESNNE